MENTKTQYALLFSISGDSVMYKKTIGYLLGRNIAPLDFMVTRDVCKTLTSRPFSMKHLPKSSPYLVHDETKSFGSTPLSHPLDATAKILNGNLYQINNFKVKKKV